MASKPSLRAFFSSDFTCSSVWATPYGTGWPPFPSVAMTTRSTTDSIQLRSPYVAGPPHQSNILWRVVRSIIVAHKKAHNHPAGPDAISTGRVLPHYRTRICRPVGGAREQASECKAASRVNGDRIRPMRLWRGAPGNRLPGVLGLARPLAIDPARAWRRLCHLCWSLEKSRPYHARQSPRRPSSRTKPATPPEASARHAARPCSTSGHARRK